MIGRGELAFSCIDPFVARETQSFSSELSHHLVLRIVLTLILYYVICVHSLTIDLTIGIGFSASIPSDVDFHHYKVMFRNRASLFASSPDQLCESVRQ